MLIGWKAAVHDPKIASFRYRVLEPLAALASRGHEVELFSDERADLYDLVVFSKAYRITEQVLARAFRARGAAVALDLCDNHFYNPHGLPRYRQARADLLAMIALADRLVVSTPVLGDIVRVEAGLGDPPCVVGDVAEHILLPPRVPRQGKMLLWFGSHGSPNAPSGMNDLMSIAPVLQAQHARTAFELVVASNDPAKFALLAPRLGVPSRYVAWSQEGFPALLAQADGVVIPLSGNPFVAAKTHNRISAALWAGVPVVADTIDSYREFAPFAWLDDWSEGLRVVLEDNDAARMRAAGARDHIERHWSMAQLAPAWEAALGLSGDSRRTSRPNHITTASGHRLPASDGKDTEISPPPPQREFVRRSVTIPSYQGALDAPQADRITGWARSICDPGKAARITLEADGMVVAEVQAGLPRPDLAAAGFREHGCGFGLIVPPEWRDDRPRRFRVVADGVHTIEEGERRFRTVGELPPLPAMDVVEQQLRAVAELLPVESGLAGRARQADELRLQSRLADELESLAEAVEQVRRIAARIVLAAGGETHLPGG